MLECLDTWSSPAPAIRYLYTDLSEYNIDVLRSHPALQPLIAEGLVDFAVFDALEGEEIVLQQHGIVLRAGESANPAVVIANYVFDGLPQDCFRINDKGLDEGLTLVHHDSTSGYEPEALAGDTLEFFYRPLLQAAYPEPRWNAVLDNYLSLPAGTTVLFPEAALRCTDRLRRFWNRGFLLLSSDKGITQRDDLMNQGDPILAKHGSFSFLVNFHALGIDASVCGDQWLASTHQETCLATIALLHGPQQACFDNTRQAFQDWIEAHGPDDFFIVRQLMLSNIDQCTLEQVLVMLRFTGWDHTVLLAAKQHLRTMVRVADERERELVRQALYSVWDQHFLLRERETSLSASASCS